MIDRLRRLPGFDALDDDALETILARSPLRSYAPGQIVLAAGTVAETLLGAIDGTLIGPEGRAAPLVFDAPGLLFGLAAEGDYVAGPEGLKAIAVSKPHVFTIAREFPEFIVSLIHSIEPRR